MNIKVVYSAYGFIYIVCENDFGATFKIPLNKDEAKELVNQLQVLIYESED